MAVVCPDHSTHFQKIQVGRDYGDKLEIISGLQPGDLVIANPSDTVLEGVKVDPVPPIPLAHFLRAASAFMPARWEKAHLCKRLMGRLLLKEFRPAVRFKIPSCRAVHRNNRAKDCTPY
jgi:hypothetical protein